MANAGNMIMEEVVEFLSNTPPFNRLDASLIGDIASGVLMEFYPEGHVVLMQGGPAADCMSIVKNGGIKVFVKTGENEDIMVDYIGEGESFGLLSVVSGGMSHDTVTAAEDTVCYSIKKEIVLDLMETNAAFSSFYMKSFFKKFIDIGYKEIHDRSLLYGGGDKLLFTNTLNDIASRNIITAPQDISIKEAADKMSRHKISSLVLLDPDGFPAGVVTDKDLRNKVTAKGRDVGEPVSNIMSVTLIKSEAGDYCFEALLKMIRYNIHHLLIVNKGNISGIMTGHDLMMMQGASPLSVAREIENQSTPDGLIPVSKKINKIITVLIKEEAKASNITRIITEINDRLVRKLLEITEKRLGPPPVNYCWIVFGSEGRKEQTFRSDQDNAIIYADPEKDGDKVEKYFSDFTLYMKAALVKCGFPACRADYMASNPKWRGPLKAWKGYFSKWINTPTPEAVLSSLIFFDFRPVHGDFTLAEKLRAYLGSALRNQKMFLTHMAATILKNRPPIGLFGRFTPEKKGDQKGAVNIKMNGLGPIIDAARLCALDIGMYNTSTLERLNDLKDRHSAVAEFCEELAQSFEFLMSLRLRHQYRQMESGIEPDNFINPETLGSLDQKMLKELFRIVSRAQESIKRQYAEGMAH